MKILIICSKAFYKDIEPIKEKLEEMGHIVELPNSYYEGNVEEKAWKLGTKAHLEFKARMFKMSKERIGKMDAVLTLNFDKKQTKKAGKTAGNGQEKVRSPPQAEIRPAGRRVKRSRPDSDSDFPAAEYK